jgi:hypothetical protein
MVEEDSSVVTGPSMTGETQQQQQQHFFWALVHMHVPWQAADWIGCPLLNMYAKSMSCRDSSLWQGCVMLHAAGVVH